MTKATPKERVQLALDVFDQDLRHQPKTITREHVLKALEDIRSEGLPKKREPAKFNLVHHGRLYPAKYTLSIAAKYASTEDIPDATFSGEDEATAFLVGVGFEIQAKRKDWSWKECYFAVWGYDQLDLDTDQVKTVLYHEVSELIGRTAKSVEFKLQNVSSFDPRPREQKPIAEAKNAQALLGEVYQWYWADRLRARAFYAQYRDEFLFNLESTTKLSETPSTNPLTIIEEGAFNTAPASRRKRSQKLLDAGRRHFRAQDGKLRCYACDFVTPEGLSVEVVQLHHTDPIYEVDVEGRKLALEDAVKSLIPLCPTCHALAHTSRPPLSVRAIKTLREFGPNS